MIICSKSKSEFELCGDNFIILLLLGKAVNLFYLILISLIDGILVHNTKLIGPIIKSNTYVT